MPRQRRNSAIELNFDGLTDSVTNLVGALILLVVLLLAITKEIPLNATPAMQGAARPAPLDGSKTIDELWLQVTQLRLQIKAADQYIATAEARVEELGAQAATLIERSRAGSN